MDKGIRWIQRFDNYKKAYNVMREGVELAQKKPLSKLEKLGLIQSFEYTHELAWNTLKDYLTDKGIIGLIGSKDTARAAFKAELIQNGDTWMEMVKARNLTSHTYDEAIAENVYRMIIDHFYPEFRDFLDQFTTLVKKV